MRRSPLRRGPFAAMLCMTTICAGAVSAPAFADSPGTPSSAPVTTIAKVGVAFKRLNVRSGGKASVRGTVRPGTPGLVVLLQIRRGGRWRTIDRDRTAATGHYALLDRRRAPMSVPVRVRVRRAGGHATRRLGRLNVFRMALASWYGPGLYGFRTGCGGRLIPGRLGVANKSLPCGTKVTLRHRGHVVRVPVIDRGPYSGAREYDLTEATAHRLHFQGYGGIQTTR